MSLRLYNTLTRQKEIFEPVTPGKVGIYLCGPTVYKDSHIGHAVGPVIFDALKRYLTYKGYKVTLIINITDVDDKLIIEAASRGITVKELAEEVSAGYFESMKALGVTSVDIYPRATEHIGDIINIIQKLGENNAAYVADGDVYFDISKCKDYGKLSNRSSEDQLQGSRELAGSGKRNAGDFALWKKAGEDEIGWDSPWGKGRPGWHIECSAMSMKYLGETFDIHGGGLDLIFPHHENEIAQSETATCKCFAKYWMHNGLTRVKTKASSGQWKSEKMSKSLGNIKPLREMLSEYPAQYTRFFLLSTHYRRPIDFSEDSMAAVQKGVKNLYRLLERIERIGGGDLYAADCDARQMSELARNEADKELVETVLQSRLRYLEMLDDDFNTAGAIAVLHELCNTINRYIDKQQLEIKKSDYIKQLILESGRMLTSLGQILGLLQEPLAKEDAGDNELAGQLMELLLELRGQARADKNFALSDAIRDKLAKLNITIEDRPDGAKWSVNS